MQFKRYLSEVPGKKILARAKLTVPVQFLNQNNVWENSQCLNEPNRSSIRQLLLSSQA